MTHFELRNKANSSKGQRVESLKLTGIGCLSANIRRQVFIFLILYLLWSNVQYCGCISMTIMMVQLELRFTNVIRRGRPDVLLEYLLSQVLGQDVKTGSVKMNQTHRGAPAMNPGADLDAGAVSEEGLGALRVVKRPVADAAPRRPDGEAAAVKQVAGPVAVLGCLVYNLERDQWN